MLRAPKEIVVVKKLIESVKNWLKDFLKRRKSRNPIKVGFQRRLQRFSWLYVERKSL